MSDETEADQQTYDPARYMHDHVRPQVEELWLGVEADLRASGAQIATSWPVDERWAFTMYDAQKEPVKALTFGCHVPFHAELPTLLRSVARAVEGTARVILAERDKRGAAGLPVLIKHRPVPCLGVDGLVHIRARIGFMRAEPEEVLPVRSDQLLRQGLMTDEQLAAEQARKAGGWQT